MKPHGRLRSAAQYAIRRAPASLALLVLIGFAVGHRGCREEPAAHKPTPVTTSPADEAPADGQPAVAPPYSFVPPEPDISGLEAVSKKVITAARARQAANSGDPEANGRLGMLYHAHGFTESAIPLYRRAIEQAPSELRWQYYLGRASAETGDVTGAISALQQASAQRPDYVPVLQVLGDLNFQTGAMDRARSYYQKALEVKPDCAPALLGSAQVELAAKNVDAAIDLLERALTAAPESGLIRGTLMEAYRGAGRTDDAARVIRGHPANALPPALDDPEMERIAELATGSEAEFRRGVDAIDRGDIEGALRHLAIAVQFNPSLVPARMALADVLTGIGRPQDAERHCRAVLEGDPTNVDALYTLSLAQAALGDREAALATLRDLLHAHPENVMALTGIADLLRRSGDLTGALEYLERAAVLAPQDADVAYGLAMVHLAQGEGQKAFDQLRAAVRLDSGHAQAHGKLGEILAASGQVREAIEHFESALLSDPWHEDAYAHLGHLWWSSGEFHAAATALREGLSQLPASQKIRGNLAWLLATCPADDVRDGAEALRLIDEICPADTCSEAPLLDIRAAALAATGRFEEATSIADRVVDLVSKTGNEALYRETARRVVLYAHRQPFRMSPKADGPSLEGS